MANEALPRAPHRPVALLRTACGSSSISFRVEWADDYINHPLINDVVIRSRRPFSGCKHRGRCTGLLSRRGWVRSPGIPCNRSARARESRTEVPASGTDGSGIRAREPITFRDLLMAGCLALNQAIVVRLHVPEL